MCFSAGASFTAGVLLTFVGTETIKKVHKPSQIVFAGIPAFFALQQFSEGVLWLTMNHAGYAALQTAVTYIFIVMAQIVWPAMIPLSVFLLEENRVRKRILKALLGIGAVVAAYNLYMLVIHGIHAEISGRHLVYQSGYQDSLGMAALSVYLAVTILPIFVSGIKRMYILGIIMAAAFAVSALFYMQCLTSVWCFFAAVISFVVFYIIRDAHKKFHMSSA
jgi:hypothetical protein